MVTTHGLRVEIDRLLETLRRPSLVAGLAFVTVMRRNESGGLERFIINMPAAGSLVAPAEDAPSLDISSDGTRIVFEFADETARRLYVGRGTSLALSPLIVH